MTGRFGTKDDAEYIVFLESMVRVLRDRALLEEEKYFDVLGYLGLVLAANNNRVVLSKELQGSFDPQQWDIDEHEEPDTHNLIIELLPHMEKVE